MDAVGLQDYTIVMADGSTSALTAALNWVQGLLLGSVATTVAILAVAGIGFLALQGRMPTQRGARVIVGCFIIFSAGAIANGLVTATASSPAPPPTEPIESAYTPSTPAPSSYDPYSGASMPDQKTKDIFR